MMSEPTKTKRFKTIYKNDDVIEKIERYIYVYRLSTFTQQDEALASQFWDFREPIFFHRIEKFKQLFVNISEIPLFTICFHVLLIYP